MDNEYASFSNSTDEPSPTEQGSAVFWDKLPPYQRRAFILAEDDEWEKADSYFETILDEEPENAYAYLGKLFVENKVSSIEALLRVQGVESQKNYSRVMKYADDELKECIKNKLIPNVDKLSDEILSPTPSIESKEVISGSKTDTEEKPQKRIYYDVVLMDGGSAVMDNIELGAYAKKMTEKFQICKKEATEGNVDSQFTLAQMYETGTGTSQDIEKAIHWYEIAANNNHSEAQFHLASLYDAGNRIPQDFEKAAFWYEKSATNGNPKAQNCLGCMYDAGQGKPKDYQKAFYWFEKAAKQNEANAQYNMGILFYYGDGVSQDITEAIEWLKKSSENGYGKASMALSTLFHNGYSVKRDLQEALRFAELAEEQGDDDAYDRLEKINEEILLMRELQTLARDVNSINSAYCALLEEVLNQIIGQSVNYSRVLADTNLLKKNIDAYKEKIGDYMNRILDYDDFLATEEALASILHEYCNYRYSSMDVFIRIVDGLQKRSNGILFGYSKGQYKRDIIELNKSEELSSRKGTEINSRFQSWESSIPASNPTSILNRIEKILSP